MRIATVGYKYEDGIFVVSVTKDDAKLNIRIKKEEFDGQNTGTCPQGDDSADK